MRPRSDDLGMPPYGKGKTFVALALLQDTSRSWTRATLANAVLLNKTTVKKHVEAWAEAGVIDLVPAAASGSSADRAATYAVLPEGVAVLRAEVTANVFDGTCLKVAARLNLSVSKALGNLLQEDSPGSEPAAAIAVRRLQFVRPQPELGTQ